MTLSRILLAIAAVSMLLLAVSNASARRLDANPSQATPPACNFAGPSAPTLPCSAGGQTFTTPQALGSYCQSHQDVCRPSGTGGGPQGGGPQGGGPQGGGPQGGGPQGGGQQGGPPLEPCAPGVLPTNTTPCLIPDCEAGQRPSNQKPCRQSNSGGGGGGGGNGESSGDGGFDAPPTAGIQKEMKSKYMVINIDVEGSGEKDGSFDVTFQKVVSGVSKTSISFLNDQLEGDSFVIGTSAKTVCFADTPDKDKVPDEVSCRKLDEAADKYPGSIKSQFRGKVNFNSATYEPVFTASKIIFLKGTFNVAKIAH